MFAFICWMLLLRFLHIMTNSFHFHCCLEFHCKNIPLSDLLLMGVWVIYSVGLFWIILSSAFLYMFWNNIWEWFFKGTYVGFLDKKGLFISLIEKSIPNDLYCKKCESYLQIRTIDWPCLFQGGHSQGQFRSVGTGVGLWWEWYGMKRG